MFSVDSIFTKSVAGFGYTLTVLSEPSSSMLEIIGHTIFEASDSH